MTKPTKPTTPTMKPATPASTRDRLLDAAAELFYQEGLGVGVEALCRTAGVSKRSMYQLFDSKDEVMAASLERSALAYKAALQPSTMTAGRRARGSCTCSSVWRRLLRHRTSGVAHSWRRPWRSSRLSTRRAWSPAGARTR